MAVKDVKKAVRARYGQIAKGGGSCCSSSSCCGGNVNIDNIGKTIGYSESDLDSVPDGANLGLGCGNPLALASIKKGETILDLGSGAGFDCFLAAKRTGPKGKVIGVDMTHEMLDKARENAKKGGYKNVEFRLGEIEHLPIPDSSVDVIISNCVINLSTDKEQVFREAFRVLRPGGRLMVSDLVLIKPIPKKIMDSIEAYVGCISGAISKEGYLSGLKKAGFKDVKILDEAIYPFETVLTDPTTKQMMEGFNISPKEARDLTDSVASVKVAGVKKGK